MRDTGIGVAMTKWYKLLDSEGRACNNDGNRWQWPLPTKNADGSWTPGEWTSIIQNIEMCARGYHLVDAAHILRWRGDTLWEAEIAPNAEKIEDGGKAVVSSCRLTRQIETYTPRTLRLLACDYAEHVLPIWETRFPDDLRPRQAIETARRFANGEVTALELADICSATYDVAADVAYAVAAYAAYDAIYAAADAAYAIAEVAVRSAARSAARAAAEVAARAVTRSSARSAAALAATNAERSWQAARLYEILGLEI